MIDIQKLRTRQDEYDERKKALLQKVYAFRGGFIKRLNEFAEQAQDAGLRGVSTCEIRQKTEKFAEVVFEVDAHDIILISSDGVYYFNPDSDVLVAKMHIYTNDDDEAPPFIEISFFDRGDGEYRLNLTTGSRFPHFGLQQIDESAGRETVDALLNLLYEMKSVWKEKPTLRVMRKGIAPSRPLGFVPSR